MNNTPQNTLKTVRMGGKGEEMQCGGIRLTWAQYILEAKYQGKTPTEQWTDTWTMNRHLTNKEQECRAGHVKGKALTEEGG
jgi:hypothetical protein